MKLALFCGKKQFRFDETKVIGRKDFPSQNLLSRQHFEIRRDQDGRIYVVDLKSVNGSNLHGQRLQPNTPIEFKPGDLLQAGGLTFTLGPEKNQLSPYLTIALSILAGLFLFVLCGPSMAFGRAIGFSASFLIFILLALPLAGTVYFVDRVMTHRKKRWPLAVYALVVLVSTVILNDFLVSVVDWNGDLEMMIRINKIHYFCSEKFKPNECVKQINSCPQCPNKIGNDERQKIANQLTNFFRQPASINTPATHK